MYCSFCGYELEKQRKELEDKYKRLLPKKVPFPYIDWATGDTCVELIQINCIQDWEAVNDYWNVIMQDYGSCDIDEPKAYPVTMMVISDNLYVRGMFDFNAEKLLNQLVECAKLLEETFDK